MQAALLAAALASGAYAQNAPPGDPSAQTPAQLRQLASSALDQKNPARAIELADQVQPGSKEYGAAQALKARALKQMGDVRGALAAWRNALKDPALRATATANIKLLGGGVEGRGERGQSGAMVSAPAGGSYYGLTSRDLNLIASMFRSQDASQTLAATLRKAAQGDASGMADLRRHGIDFARGPAEQQAAVVIEPKNGMETVTFSPAVLDNPDKSRAISGMANGVEQAATQRDFNGISFWLRQWGGRLVGVLVYLQLSPKEQGMAPTQQYDKDLVSDRIAYGSAHVGAVPNLPNGQTFRYLMARNQAQADDVTDAPSIFLYFCGQSASTPLKPGALQGDDLLYDQQLKELGE